MNRRRPRGILQAKKQEAQSLTLQVTSFGIVHCEAMAVMFFCVSLSREIVFLCECVFWLFQEMFSQGRERIYYEGEEWFEIWKKKMGDKK